MSARTVYVNRYAFTTGLSPRPPTPTILERGIGDVWANDFLPEMQAQVHAVQAGDYDRMSLEDLGELTGKLMTDTVHGFGFSMLAITGFMGPTFGLVHFLQEELGPEAPQLAATLLQGFANETGAAGAGLSSLAEAAAARPAVAAALREGRYDAIESVDGGAEFMALLQDYLDSYGWRLESWGLLHLPTWAENPRLPLMLIGRYVGNPSHSPSASIERSVKQRGDAARDVEARLGPEKLGPFHEMLAATQSHVAVSEGRALWKLLTIGSLRIPMLALGRKLASRGALAEANDVFFLDSKELQEAAQAPTPTVRELASKRRADLERWEKLTPPPFIGTPMDPSQLPPELAPLFVLFFGAGKPDFQGGEIKGQSASQGKVRGRARVISDLADSERLQEGDILVCQMTAPPWTPLFAIAGAVVTDSGGVLSHSAICAREYAIPCVVATQIATHVIPDGAMIEVDGTAGIVRIEG